MSWVEPYMFWIKLVALAAIATLLFFAGWRVASWRCDAAQEKAVQAALLTQQTEYETRDSDYLTQLKTDQDLLDTATNKLAALQSQYDKLAIGALQSHAPLIKTVTKVIHENCECPVSTMSDAFRLCFNAAVSGASSAAAAACEAGGVPAANSPK